MQEYQNKINSQIKLNEGINLFREEVLLKLSKESLLIIDQIESLGESAKRNLIDYTINKVLEEFYRINQYYNFNKQAKNNLRIIYENLYTDVKDKIFSNEELALRHYSRLKEWLFATNSFADKVYSTKNDRVEAVPCFEYIPSLQLDILKINLSDMIEPVLDIGCGQQGSLVLYMRDKGVEAFGIDRFPSESPYIQNADWLEYDYGIKKWGTIISNLGFSNHFVHHHLRADSNYIDYAKKYMLILESLQIGGSFHYAPDLSFIEEYLDNKIYEIKSENIGHNNYKSTIIKRLS